MKSLVVYASQTENTKKLAQAVFEALSGDKVLHPIDKAVPRADDYDLVAVGFWLQAGKPVAPAADYLAAIGPGKKVFLFATHGAAVDSGHARAAMDNARSLVPAGSEVVGVFHCQGEVNPAFLEKASARPDPPPWLKDAPLAAGHPDAADIAALKKIVSDL
ncbi:MAG: flavodoxin family protein [Thermodesulfobacteriota bacterium]|nr:flavodoxin family protein [Thermodesulfobacteriota bacterium]